MGDRYRKTRFGQPARLGEPKNHPSSQAEKRLIFGLAIIGLLVIGTLVVLGVQGQIKYSVETHQSTAQFLQMCTQISQLNYLNPHPVPTIFNCP